MTLNDPLDLELDLLKARNSHYKPSKTSITFTAKEMKNPESGKMTGKGKNPEYKMNQHDTAVSIISFTSSRIKL